MRNIIRMRKYQLYQQERYVDGKYIRYIWSHIDVMIEKKDLKKAKACIARKVCTATSCSAEHESDGALEPGHPVPDNRTGS